MLEKFFRFIGGYAVVELSGSETALEKVRKSGIFAGNIIARDGKTVFEITAKGLDKLEKLDIDFVIIKRCGGRFFLKKAIAHPVLLAGILLVGAVVYLGSGFIWTVEYEGVSERNLEQVASATQKAGVTVGAYKKRMMSPLELKNVILANTNDLSWCWVYIKGSRAVVKVRENSIPPAIFNPDTPCDLVAGKDGIIKNITAERGKVVGVRGNAVSAGDVVVSGRVEFGEDDGYQVHARGECRALVSYQKEGVYKLYRNYKSYTGKRRNFLTLKLFSLEIPLHFGKVDFPYCDKVEKVYEISLGKENYMGLGLEKVSFFEYNIMKEPISRELCAQLAKSELEEMIAKELYPGSVKLSEDLAVDIIDEETISVRLMMEFDENIAVEKIIEEVTIFEPKTD